MVYVDKVVKKIQTEGKWHSVRTLIDKDSRKPSKPDSVWDSKNCPPLSARLSKTTAEVFVDDVQHGYDRELGPVLIGHEFWNRLHFPSILRACGFNPSQIQTAELSVLNRLIAQDSENALILRIYSVAYSFMDLGSFSKIF